jgi:hypothetical protein
VNQRAFRALGGNMGLNYEDLDEITRQYMIKELDLDISSEKVYFSKRFNSSGNEKWISLLRDAILHHNDDWLAEQLRCQECLKHIELNLVTGRTRKVSRKAPETLAEDQFNRYYTRAICKRCSSEGISHVQVYRAKHVMRPTLESEWKINQSFPINEILMDLRSSQGTSTYLGIPRGANSGITVRPIRPFKP